MKYFIIEYYFQEPAWDEFNKEEVSAVEIMAESESDARLKFEDLRVSAVQGSNLYYCTGIDRIIQEG